MKKIIKAYILLYNEKSWNKTQGNIVSLRFDRIKHGFAGDFISILAFVLIGNWNNWGENLHFNGDTMWWLYYVLTPFLIAFSVGVGKEFYDKKTTGLFDWGDVWATMLPFSLVYHVIRELLLIAAPQLIKKIEDEILK